MIVLVLSAHTTSTLLLTSTRATCPTEGCGNKRAACQSLFFPRHFSAQPGRFGEADIPQVGDPPKAVPAAEVTGALRSFGEGEKILHNTAIGMGKSLLLEKERANRAGLAADPDF